ncbi:glycosyltransferase family 1 protein [Variovorax sp. LjRoot290]|uniref:glycosyltransferase family 4 protein n=1 Tax=Variovorax sp. LjRoot290 TaxID=3342316 RepID=UPI003ED1103E
MRIVIDLQGAQTESRLRGIGRYSVALATAMVRHRRNHEVLIALNGLFPETIEPIRAAFKGLLPQQNIRIWTAPSPVNAFDSANNWRRGAAEIIREEFLESLRPDIVHISSLLEGFADDAIHSIGRLNRRIPTAATFYDAIPLVQKDVYLDPNPKFAIAYLEKLEHLKRADLLLAISESAREEAMRYLDRPAERVVNIGAATDAQFNVIDIDTATKESLGRRFGFRDGFLMYSGATDERKNHLRLIEAFSLLPQALRKRHPLLIVGGMPASHRERFLAHARSFGLSAHDVVLTGRVSDEELVALYNLCSLFVLPSWHEGFGLPALEAMSCGAAVIGSKTSSIPEVIGRDDALFDPYSAQAIMQKIAQVLSDATLRNELAQHGLQQAAKFSWDKSATRALDAFEHFVGTTGRSNLETANDHPDNRIASVVTRIANTSAPTWGDEDLLRAAQAISFNVRRSRNRMLFLDISTIVHVDAKSGIQRVVRSLLHELLRNPPPDTDVASIYFEAGHFRLVKVLPADESGDSRYVATSEVVDLRQGDTYLALDLNAHLSEATHDLHLRLRQLGVDLYFVIYDILIIHRPDWWAENIAPLFERWLKSVAQVATGLICISATVADDVIEWLGNNPPDRLYGPLVRSFHLGADIENSRPSTGMPSDASEILESIRSSVSFLMVGTIEPRKGHAQAIGAFELLWQQGIDISLVIVGKKGWLVDELHDRLCAHPELGHKLHVLTGVSDEYLDRIYAACSCLLVPSEGEGFGLPLIEAAMKGKPIIARDIPVFREVAGDHSYYFDGLSAVDLSEHLKLWIALREAGNEPRSAGLQWLTWKQSAQQLLTCMFDEPGGGPRTENSVAGTDC